MLSIEVNRDNYKKILRHIKVLNPNIKWIYSNSDLDEIPTRLSSYSKYIRSKYLYLKDNKLGWGYEPSGKVCKDVEELLNELNNNENTSF